MVCDYPVSALYRPIANVLIRLRSSLIHFTALGYRRTERRGRNLNTMMAWRGRCSRLGMTAEG
jgi:hypothetical protein